MLVGGSYWPSASSLGIGVKGIDGFFNGVEVSAPQPTACAPLRWRRFCWGVELGMLRAWMKSIEVSSAGELIK